MLDIQDKIVFVINQNKSKEFKQCLVILIMKIGESKRAVSSQRKFFS